MCIRLQFEEANADIPLKEANRSCGQRTWKRSKALGEVRFKLREGLHGGNADAIFAL
jgi:hypothetical protein